MQTSTFSDLISFIGFPFRDAEWKRKLGIAALVGFAVAVIPILPLLALNGYGARLARRVLEAPEGELPQLPEWDDWEALLMDGLRVTAAILTLLLPLIFGALLLFGVLVTPVFAVNPSASQGELAVILVIFLATFLTLLVILAIFLLGLVIPAAVTHVIARRSYGAVFEVKDWLSIWWANWSGFLISVLVVMAISLVLSIGAAMLGATVVLLCLAPLMAGAITAYVTLLQLALGGREYRIGRQRVRQRLGVVAPPEAPEAVEMAPLAPPVEPDASEPLS